MKNTKKYVALIVAFCLFQGFSYSELFMSKQKKEYRRKMKEAILQDWNQQSISEHAAQSQQSERLMPEPDSFKQSRCKDKDFETYQLTKGYIGTAVNNVTAYYCSAEQRYWISELMGDMVLKGNWYGPFELKRKV